MSHTSAAELAPAPPLEVDVAQRALRRRTTLLRLLSAAAPLVVWFVPPPDGLALEAWRLFAIFAAAIFSVIVGAFPLLTASVLALAASVLSGLVSPEKAYAGFANGTILLIVLAFLVARSVVKCGLGTRIGQMMVARFGRSTLGLSYSILLVDGVIAPAFPSNTARSGVVFPLALSLADVVGARPGEGTLPRLGSFLMFSGIASLSLSSGLWLTAMAANPIGAEIARGFGVDIGFGSWLLAASVPTLAAMALIPPLLFWILAPELKATPEAPAAARRALAQLGPLSRDERIVLATFVGMVALWGLASQLGIDSTAVAFLGLGVLLVSGALTPADIAKQGDVLATFLWFAVLFTLSSQLNELGFMSFARRTPRGQAGRMDAWGSRFGAHRDLRSAALHLRESDGAPAGPLWHLHGRRGQARRQSCAAGLPSALRDQLLLRHYATGFERKSSVRRKRIPVPTRPVSARVFRDRVQRAVVRGPGNTVAGADRSRTLVRFIMTVHIRATVVAAIVSAIVILQPSAVAQTPAKLPTIVVLATGGTIAGAAASDVQAGYTSGQVGVEQLLAAVPQARKLATLRGEQVANIGSQDMNDEVWLKLAGRINALAADAAVDGIVITHGTDTIEETAYFLNLVVKTRKPVVLTAAMRPSTALSADGPLNFFNAVAVAANPKAAGLGVLVVVNDWIHGASSLTKTSTTAVQTFLSPVTGLIGTVAYGQADFYRGPIGRHTTESEFSLTGVTSLPRVDIIMAYENMDGALIDAAVAAGARGVVIAGVGNGNLTKPALDTLAKHAARGIVGLRSSRVATGHVGRNVEVDDDKLGLIASKDLNPQKSRVLLRLALLQKRTPADLQRLFDEY